MEVHGRAEMYNHAVGEIEKDDGVDAIIIQSAAWKNAIDFVEVTKRNISGKPVFVWLVGSRETVSEFRAEGQKFKVPVFNDISRAVECMSAVFSKNAHCVKGTSVPQRSKTTISFEALTGDAKGSPWDAIAALSPLDECASKRVLASYGIPTVAEQIVANKIGVVKACDDMGFPVVLKGLLPGCIHKTELGLVHLNITNKKSAVRIFEQLSLKMQGKGRVVVQKQAGGKVEIILGLLKDANFGPCVMCGIGGVYADVLNDAVFALAPLSVSDALSVIGSLKNQRILDGFRGMPPVDREALAEIMVRLGDIGTDYAAIRQIDINPLLAGPEGLIAVDATVIME